MRTLTLTALCLLPAALSLPTLAEAPAGHGTHHPAADAAPVTDSAGTRALQAANARMHAGMDIAYTGTMDIDFLRGMIAHHQGAVDMAQAQLKYGTDAQVRRMAQEIIRAQNLEIRWMQKWLAQLEAKQKGFSDSNWAGKSWMGER
jgi:uncharacterized protein (DUF305 family)